jgi:hypothetical protein
MNRVERISPPGFGLIIIGTEILYGRVRARFGAEAIPSRLRMVESACEHKRDVLFFFKDRRFSASPDVPRRSSRA